MATSPGPSSRVHFAHRLLRARDWQHRPQLDRLCRWWRGGGHGVCALIGIGGAGKTAIAERFLRILPGVMSETADIPKDTSLPHPQRLFVFSFYDAPNPDAFFAELGTWLRDDPPAESPQTTSYAQIVRLLPRAGECLLILDGLEKAQDDGARGGVFGRITDNRLRNLVECLAEGLIPGMSVIITTRFPMPELEEERPPNYASIWIEEISEQTGIDLLRSRGVNGTDPELRRIVNECGRHALTVDMAGGYIAEFGQGDPNTKLDLGTVEELEEAIKNEADVRRRRVLKQEHRFARIAQRYHEGFTKSDPAAMALLQRVCLFRLGVDTKTLASIFTGEGKEGISGPELARLNENQLRAKLTRLVEMRLLEVSDRTDSESTIENRQSKTYTIHPAVRDGFLVNLDAETAQRGHDAARVGLTASLGGLPAMHSYPSDAATLDLLEEIVYHTLEAGREGSAWWIYWEIIGSYPNLGSRLGAYERGERICRAFAAVQTPESITLPYADPEEDTPAVFINEWGLYLRHLGRLAAAACCFERNIERRMQSGEWDNAITGNRNLAMVWLLGGHLTAALRTADEALQLAERADYAGERCECHAYRAHTRALRGETKSALADFRDALQWGHKAVGKSDRPLSSQVGIWESLLLLRLTRTEEATRRTEANKKWLLEHLGPQADQAFGCNVLLADLARERRDLLAARELFREAHEWAIARDDKEVLCWSALVRARIELSDSGEHRGDEHEAEIQAPLEQARSAIEDGLRIARDCGFGIYHIDLLLVRAQVALYEGKPADAERDVRIALEEGVRPSTESGLPELFAATNPECGYAWGIAEGRHLLGEALLLQAAQTLGHPDFTPARLEQLETCVRDLIDQAREQLNAALELWHKLKDPESDAEINPHGQKTQRTLEQLDGGVLTDYPLEPILREESDGPDQDHPEETETEDTPVAKKHVFLSYCRDNSAEVAKLRGDLIAAGEQVWWDKDILPGEDWKLAIRRAMKDSYAVVLCLSKETEIRKTSGVFPEVSDAIAAYREYAPGSIFLIPVRLSQCKIPDSEIDSTRTLDRLQYVDLFPSAKRNEGLQRLIQSLQETPHHA